MRYIEFGKLYYSCINTHSTFEYVSLNLLWDTRIVTHRETRIPNLNQILTTKYIHITPNYSLSPTSFTQTKPPWTPLIFFSVRFQNRTNSSSPNNPHNNPCNVKLNSKTIMSRTTRTSKADECARARREKPICTSISNTAKSVYPIRRYVARKLYVHMWSYTRGVHTCMETARRGAQIGGGRAQAIAIAHYAFAARVCAG